MTTELFEDWGDTHRPLGEPASPHCSPSAPQDHVEQSRDATKSTDDMQEQDPERTDEQKENKASTRVGSVCELLESILVNLPPRDLFVFQSVNSTWFELINRSHNLRRHMSLQARSSHMDTLRPLQLTWIPFYDELPEGFKFTPTLHMQHFALHQNPTAKLGQPVSASVQAIHIQCAQHGVYARLQIKIRLLFADTVEKGNSWRNIQITDPPMNRICLEVDNDGIGDRTHTVECEGGLTLGGVDEARETFVNKLWDEESIEVSKDDVYASIVIEPYDEASCDHAEQHCAGVIEVYHDVMFDCSSDHECASICRDFIDTEKMEEMFKPVKWFGWDRWPHP